MLWIARNLVQNPNGSEDFLKFLESYIILYAAPYKTKSDRVVDSCHTYIENSMEKK